MALNTTICHLGTIGRATTRALGTAQPAASELPPMPAFDYTPPTYKGYGREDVMRLRKQHVNPAVHRQTFFKNPPLFTAGKMQYLYDSEGKRYIDCFGGICTVSAGHAHDKVNAAITEQMSRLTHTSNVFMHGPLAEYVEKLTSKIPKETGLSVAYICNSGSEANDLALQMARAYTGNLNVIGLRRAYHGASAANLALTTMPFYRSSVPMPINNVSATMSPDPYRGLWGGKHCRDGPSQTLRDCDCAPGVCNAAANYVNEYEDHLMHMCPPGKGVAAFFAEGMGGMSAAQQSPIGYLAGAYEATRARGGVCVMDEVQTGFGRLGSHYWGFEAHGVVPDIITGAKSIGNGFPLAMCITRPEIAEAWANSCLHFNTFGGNAIASAAGIATLEAIEEDGLQANCATTGTHFIQGLMRLREKYDCIGDVRGKGLFMAVEMVESKETNVAIAPYKMLAMMEKIKDYGVVIGRGGVYLNCFRMQPPMCLNKEDAEYVTAVLDRVFGEYERGELDVESFNPNK